MCSKRLFLLTGILGQYTERLGCMPHVSYCLDCCIVAQRLWHQFELHARTLDIQNHVPTPPPCCETSFLSIFSTFRLSKALSSGLMTRGLGFGTPVSCSVELLAFALAALRAPSAPVALPELPGLAGGAAGALPSASLRWRIFGVGKLSFLSMASTVRWKRRKSC